MGMARERGEAWEDGPPPMDEGWWASVLGEQEAQAPPTRPRGGETGIDRINCPGSAEDWSWARELYEFGQHGRVAGDWLQPWRTAGPGPWPAGFRPSLAPGEPASGERRGRPLGSAVGRWWARTLCLKVIEFDPERGRLVFSQRAAQAGPGCRAELLARLRPGDRVSGLVTNITRFGVFVELGGVEGLIHVSELSWGRVRHPSDAVCCGQHVEVKVLSVDREQGRVALSLKDLMPDPWQTVEDRYSVGEIVEGVVTNVVRFGAFVGLEEGLEGLVHISEFGDGSGRQAPHGLNGLQEGERVRARVVHIDGGERRLGLSLRLAEPGEAASGPEVVASH